MGICEKEYLIKLMVKTVRIQKLTNRSRVLSPKATDIKAQGEMSDANGTLGRRPENIRSLKATNRSQFWRTHDDPVGLFVAFSDGSVFPSKPGVPPDGFTPGFNVGHLW